MTAPVIPSVHPRFVLAADHRRPHLAALLGRPAGRDHGDLGPTDRAAIVAAKETIAAGFERAVAAGVDPTDAGLLIDEEYGAAAARAAIAAGRTVLMPVEASGLDHFTPADPGIVDRVLEVGPAWVKALVRYNVDGDPAKNGASVAALDELAARLPAGGPRLMIEVVVPPTAAQLAAAGDAETFVRTQRAALIEHAVRALLAAGLEPELWKVEGIDDPVDAREVASAAGTARRRAGLLVLGAGAPPACVDEWLRVAARTPGYQGFAVGRSLWWAEIRALLVGRGDRDDAVTAIAANFRHAIDVYTGAT